MIQSSSLEFFFIIPKNSPKSISPLESSSIFWKIMSECFLPTIPIRSLTICELMKSWNSSLSMRPLPSVSKWRQAFCKSSWNGQVLRSFGFRNVIFRPRSKCWRKTLIKLLFFSDNLYSSLVNGNFFGTCSLLPYFFPFSSFGVTGFQGGYSRMFISNIYF